MEQGFERRGVLVPRLSEGWLAELMAVVHALVVFGALPPPQVPCPVTWWTSACRFFRFVDAEDRTGPTVASVGMQCGVCRSLDDGDRESVEAAPPCLGRLLRSGLCIGDIDALRQRWNYSSGVEL